MLRLKYDPDGLDSERPVYALAIVLTIILTVREMLDLGDVTSKIANSLSELIGLETKARAQLGAVETGASAAAFRHFADGSASERPSLDALALATRSPPADTFILPARNRRAGPGLVDVLDEALRTLERTKEDIKALLAIRVAKGLVRDDAVSPFVSTPDSEAPTTPYELSESASWFMSSLDRVAKRGYQPSEDDILRLRISTCGIEECARPFEVRLTRAGSCFRSIRIAISD